MMDNESDINSNAVICVVLGAVKLVLPLLGIITGIMGIVYYNKAKKEMPVKGETGEGVAITGLTLSIVGLVLQVVIIFSLLLFFFLLRIEVMFYYLSLLRKK